MPVAADTVIYPNETFWWRIPGVVLDAGTNQEIVLTTAQSPTFTYLIYKDGQPQGSPAPVTASATSRGTWEVKVTAPAVAGVYELRATIITAAGRGEVRDTFTVTA